MGWETFDDCHCGLGVVLRLVTRHASSARLKQQARSRRQIVDLGAGRSIDVGSAVDRSQIM